MGEHQEEYYTCKKCGRSLPVSSYNFHKQMTCGRYSACRECRSREAVERNREWVKNNPSEARKRTKTYYDKVVRPRRALIAKDSPEAEKARMKAAERYQENREALKEGRTIIPDNDPENDLVPMEAGGFVRWAVITYERRVSLGEDSLFNGLSIARDRVKDDE